MLPLDLLPCDAHATPGHPTTTPHLHACSHWVFLNSLVIIFIMCFLLFDAGSENVSAAADAERRFGFSAVVGVLVLTQTVLTVSYRWTGARELDM